MTHQDQGRNGSVCSHACDLHKALRWLMAGVSMSGIVFRPDCTWTPETLTFAALLWAWSDEKTLLERFATARKIIINRYAEQPEPAGSYQAFIKILCKWTESLREALAAAFRQRMAQVLAAVWRIEGWLVFAVDGSRVDVPRTRKNEERYSPKSKLSREAQKRRRARKRRRMARKTRERMANVPRIWLTMMWHVGSGLPWGWRTGPSNSSERGHFQEMLDLAPVGSLLTADAGFVGYDLWKTVLDAGRHLLVRVGGNVKLLKKLGYVREYDGLVYLWPDHRAKKRLPPLALRMVVVVNEDREPVYLVTDVMSQKKLSDAQMAAIYRKRWGIEVYYRHCKQTFERRKLRSHNPDNAMVELHWSLLGMWAMGLHSHSRLVGQGVSPERISFAGVWRAYRRPMREYKSFPDPGERMRQLIDRALIDPYQRRNKRSRDYPLKKQEQSAGPPILRKATRSQVQLAMQVKCEQTRKRLTA
jgi:IS4 transposase